MFERIHHNIARQQLLLLGGVRGTLVKSNSVVDPVLVLVERDVQFPTENGLVLESRTIATLLKLEAGKLIKGDQILCDGMKYPINEIISDDGFVITVFVRG
jgi:hypothetical protein